jgi:hypothetical protein
VATQRERANNILGIPTANSKHARRGEDPAGFLAGIWHGFIAPLTSFAALGNPAVREYETRNNGRWYRVGYRIGAADPFALGTD